MSASDHLHPMQMKLFVDPVEHIQSLRGSVDYSHTEEDWGDMWTRKESESRRREGVGTHGAGVYQSVKEKGVVQSWHYPINRVRLDPPINRTNTYKEATWKQSTHPQGVHGAPELHPDRGETGFIQGEGHHRIAAAAAIQRETGKQQWVPVQYSHQGMRANRT